MRPSYSHALLVLSSSFTSHAWVNTKCAHPGLRDLIRNECAEFVVTAGLDTYGVRLPVTAYQGPAMIGTKYDDRRRRRATLVDAVVTTSLAPTEALPSYSTAVVDDDDATPEPDEDGVANVDPSVTQREATGDSIPTDPSLFGPPKATITTFPGIPGSSAILHGEYNPSSTTEAPTMIASSVTVATTTDSIPVSSALTSFVNVNDQMGPGINNVPLKAIKGLGQDGNKVTYPNKHGSPLCKKAKKCIAISKNTPIRSCMDALQEQIHDLAIHHPEMAFEPLKPIACAPSLDSKYCAFIELVPWQPINDKNERLFGQMDTEPYKYMVYNPVSYTHLTLPTKRIV